MIKLSGQPATIAHLHGRFLRFCFIFKLNFAGKKIFYQEQNLFSS